MDSISKDLKIIRTSLVIIASVVVMFVLRLFSFIFIPLFLALFIALLLLPILDWFARKKLPNWVGITAIVVVSILLIILTIEIFQSTATELYSSKNEILASATEKINPVITDLKSYLGIIDESGQNNIVDVKNWVEKNSVSLIGKLSSFLTGLFMTIFFLSLFLTGANLFETYISKISNDDKNIIQTFRNIIDTLNKFIKVKFFVSILTGLIFGIIAVSFGVKFAIFWGVMAFILNFVQLIGSFFITTVLILFGFVEISTTGTLVVFSLLLISAQIFIGGVLEPILMGKSFKVNTISILISLSVWGFVFGIAGLVLAIPIMVFLKMILENIPSTKQLASLMNSVSDKK
jgi:predicted PurR-regulated permease PerM